MGAQIEGQDTEGIIEAICRQHITFERIHPFSDVNGRMGRALMVYTCLQKGIAPIVVTKDDKAIQDEITDLCNLLLAYQNGVMKPRE